LAEVEKVFVDNDHAWRMTVGMHNEGLYYYVVVGYGLGNRRGVKGGGEVAV